jgi:hypothetical protein
MHMTKKIATLALGLLGGAAAFATPPAAPQVTVGAGLKELQFDWDIVPRSNYYEFWYKSDNGAPWVKFGEQKPWAPHFINHVGAHLFNWDQARYQVKACNSVCTASAEIGVHDQMFDSIGYFKPGNVYARARFGARAAISEDDQTLAAFASHEPVPGGAIATLYVFAKVNGAWQQQKRIIPSTTIPDRLNVGDGSPFSVSLSADGNRLMTGLQVCTSSGHSSGDACYQMLSVWNRSGSTWTREFQTVTENPLYPADSAQMNEAGDRIMNGSTSTPELYERTASGWAKHAALPAVQSPANCFRIRLSGDGNTLARACWISSAAVRLLIAKAPDWKVTDNFVLPWPDQAIYGDFAIDYSGTTLALATSIWGPDGYPPDPRPQVQILKIANGALTTSILRAESWAPAANGDFGAGLALSRDGGWLAVFDGSDRGAGRGVLSPPLQPTSITSGATNIYELRQTGPRLRRVIKPNTTPWSRYSQEIAFANNGKTLLIANPDDRSSATGVDGDRNDTSANEAGALWLY